MKMKWQARFARGSLAAVLTLSASALNPVVAGECPAWVVRSMNANSNNELLANNKQQLYAASYGCAGPSCLLTEANVLRRGQTYNFFASTKQTPVRNSIVGVQIKSVSVDTQALRSSLARVSLEREPTSFACGHRDAYPPPNDPVARQDISYEQFDYYHRRPYRIPSGTVYTRLHEQYHIQYKNTDDNNKRCVRTDDSARRPLLLMSNRTDFPRSRQAGLRQAGADVATVLPLIGPAFAASYPSSEYSFSQFKLTLTNYSKRVGYAGCFTFHLNTQGLREVHITLRDLEELQIEPDWFPKEWIFGVQ